jgi:hypothetical protein
MIRKKPTLAHGLDRVCWKDPWNLEQDGKNETYLDSVDRELKHPFAHSPFDRITSSSELLMEFRLSRYEKY